VSEIHVAHFWVCMLVTLDAFIDCEIRSNFRMGASTLAVTLFIAEDFALVDTLSNVGKC
jgi:hypothetical protein